MLRLNLLPWREQLREERKIQFLIALGASVVLALLIIILAHLAIGRKIETQNRVNRFLQSEIKTLDGQINEIKALKTKKAQMLERLRLIQSLQASRPAAVRFYDELVRIMPPGIYLITMSQDGNKVLMRGKAESNTRISTLMRNIEASPWLRHPVLQEIKTDVRDQHYQREFILQLEVADTAENTKKR